QHYERTGTYQYNGGGHGNGYHSVDITSLPRGQMQVVGKNFTCPHTHNDQEKFYKNRQFFAVIKMNYNVSYSYTSPVNTFKRGDELTVKVLQYLGNGHHYEKSATYRQQHDDDHDYDPNYVIACMRNTSSISNQDLCIELRVPGRISEACGKYS